MLKKFSIIVLVFVLALSLTGIAAAGGHVLSGEVAAVDTKASTITVKTSDGNITVAVAPDAEILAGSKKKQLKDVKKGDEAKIVTVMKDGTKTAVKIKVRGPIIGC